MRLCTERRAAPCTHGCQFWDRLEQPVQALPQQLRRFARPRLFACCTRPQLGIAKTPLLGNPDF
eukprot:5285400-Amphidinium_carterae.1